MRDDEVAQLYEVCYPKMVAYLIHEFRLQQSDAQDIASQAITEEISPGGAKFDPSRGVPLLAWMVRKAAFRAKDELRKKQRRKTYINIDSEDVSIEGTPGIETPQAVNRRKLIEGLPHELRVIFELTSHEHTAEEIADILEMNVMRVRYLQRKLKKEVVRVAKRFQFEPEDLFDES
jgi:RNA polymerase sigma factor (sigma-70 family)